MSKRNGNNGKQTGFPRLLYIGTKAESLNAERVLRSRNVHFVLFRVKERRKEEIGDHKPPCLIAEQGRFSGLASIERYAERFGS